MRTKRAEAALDDMVAAVQRRGKADFAILVDDLEVANIGRAADVASYFRVAAQNLASTKSAPTVRALRDRCSVHLLAPMLEAYFFPDPGALRAAGAASPAAAASGDPEQFHTLDSAYLDAATGSYSWASSARCVHPKHYLAYLVERSPGAVFKEKHQGAAALRAVDLRKSLEPPPMAPCLSALVDDIANMLGESSPVPWRIHGATAGPATVLRNL